MPRRARITFSGTAAKQFEVPRTVVVVAYIEA